MQNIWFVKIHRKIRDNPIFWKPNYLSVFMYILLDVEFEGCKKPLRWDLVNLNPWEWLFFQKEIADKMGISLGTVSNILKKLNSENIIEIKTTSKYSIVGLVNWSTYQAQVEITSENELKTSWKRVENELKHLKNTKKTKRIIKNTKEQDFNFKKEKIAELKNKTSEGTALYRLCLFLESLGDSLEEEMIEDFADKVYQDIKLYYEKMWNTAFISEMDEFIRWHTKNKSIFKDTRWRLRTWFSKKIIT